MPDPGLDSLSPPRFPSVVAAAVEVPAAPVEIPVPVAPVIPLAAAAADDLFLEKSLWPLRSGAFFVWACRPANLCPEGRGIDSWKVIL